MTTARDTIVDALDIESFVLCAGGLKAPNMTAQGNARGSGTQKISSPERATQTSRVRFVSPFQGLNLFLGYESQGVALGYHVIALSARKTNHRDLNRPEFYQRSKHLNVPNIFQRGLNSIYDHRP